MVSVRRASGACFFDDEVSLKSKQKMVITLNEEGLDYSPKRITLEISHIEE